MTRFVVEAAIAVKWFVPEVHSSPAARLLDGGNELFATDTLLPEAGEIVTTKIRLGELTLDEGARIFEAIGTVPIRLQSSRPLLEPALLIAASLDLSLREALGLSVAVLGDCRLVTAGRPLYDRLQNTPFSVHVKWVEDLR